MKRIWALISICALLTVTTPFVSADGLASGGTDDFASEHDYDALYEVPDLEETESDAYMLEEIQKDPQRMEAFLEEQAGNAEVISTTWTAEAEEIWNRLIDLNEKVRELETVQVAVQDLKSRLIAAQQGERVVYAEEQDLSVLTNLELLNMAVGQLEDEDMATILTELEQFDNAEIEREIQQYCSEYAALEIQLQGMGATPTEEELADTLYADMPMGQTEGGAARAAPPELNCENLYTLLKTYCTVSVSGKTYTTYTIKVVDRPEINRMSQSRDWFDMYWGNTNHSDMVGEFLAEKFVGVLSGVGDVLIEKGYVAIGAIVKWGPKALLALYEYFDIEVASLYTTQPTYQIRCGINVQMKYVWVQYSDGSWWLANSANRATITETHHFNFQYYNCQHEAYEWDPININNKIELNGRFNEAESDAAVYFDNYIAYYPDLYNMWPLRNKVESFTYYGKKNGKEIKQTIVPFYAYRPIDLI